MTDLSNSAGESDLFHQDAEATTLNITNRNEFCAANSFIVTMVINGFINTDEAITKSIKK
jgi:hypothetical protein